MSLKSAATMPDNDRAWQKWCRESGDTRLITGTGSPAGIVVADRGTVFLRTDGAAGSTMYVKESGDGTSAGWGAK